jgi:hypothetical protein
VREVVGPVVEEEPLELVVAAADAVQELAVGEFRPAVPDQGVVFESVGVAVDLRAHELERAWLVIGHVRVGAGVEEVLVEPGPLDRLPADGLPSGRVGLDLHEAVGVGLTWLDFPAGPPAVVAKLDAGAVPLAGGDAFAGEHPQAVGVRFVQDAGHVRGVAAEQGRDLLHGHAFRL